MEYTTNRSAKMPIEFGKRNGRDMNGADLREINIPGAIYPDIRLKAQLSPYANAQFVSGADDKIRRHRRQIDRSEGRRNPSKQVCAKDGKNLTGGGGNELLEFGERFGRKTRFLALTVLRLLAIQLFSIGVVSIGRAWLRAEPIQTAGDAIEDSGFDPCQVSAGSTPAH